MTLFSLDRYEWQARLVPGLLALLPAAPPPRPAGRESLPFRRSVASGSPAAASRRPTVVAACNSAPTLSIAPGAPEALEMIPSLRVSAVAD
jgi:hypothetical protein